MNRVYERFMNTFPHVRKSSGWQPKFYLKLKLKPKVHPHLHLKLIRPVKPTPPGDPPPLTPPTRCRLFE